jgi:hypothetical protein
MANAGVDPSRLYSTLDRTALRAKDPVLYQLLYNLIGTLVNVVGKQAGSGGGTTGNVVNNITNVIQQMMLEDGIDGEMGSPGPRGTDGTIGHDGATGPAGPQGLSGEDGIDGETYAIPGVQGPTGNAGTNGLTGPAGPPGLQGFDGGDGETYAIPGVQGPAGNSPQPLVAGAAQVNRSTNQTISTASETAITLDTVVYDTNGYFSAGSPTRLTVPAGQDGKYIVHGQVKWTVTGAVTPAAIIGGKVNRSTNQTINNNSATQISFSGTEFDTNVFWSAGSPTRLTIPSGGEGLYVIVGQIKWSVGASGPAFIRIFKNGTTIIGESYIETVNANSTSNVACEEDLVTSDFIELQVFQVTGSSQTVVGGSNTYLSAIATVTSSPGGGPCFTRIYKNGSTLVGEGYVPLADANATTSVTAEVSLSATDYIELKVIQTSGLNQTVVGGTSTYFALEIAAGNGSGISTGAFSARPAAGSLGRLYLPNNGFSQGFDTGSAWSPFGPLYALTAPIDANFAWVNQGTATVTADKDAIALAVVAASGTSWKVRKKALSGFTRLEILMLPHTYGTGSQTALLFRESGTGKLATMSLSDGNTIAIQHWTNPTTFLANDATNIALSVRGFLWLAIAISGANLLYQSSVDGQNWVQLLSIAKTSQFTTAPDEWGFGANSGQTLYNNGLTLLSFKEIP